MWTLEGQGFGEEKEARDYQNRGGRSNIQENTGDLVLQQIIHFIKNEKKVQRLFNVQRNQKCLKNQGSNVLFAPFHYKIKHHNLEP